MSEDDSLFVSGSWQSLSNWNSDISKLSPWSSSLFDSCLIAKATGRTDITSASIIVLLCCVMFLLWMVVDLVWDLNCEMKIVDFSKAEYLWVIQYNFHYLYCTILEHL